MFVHLAVVRIDRMFGLTGPAARGPAFALIALVHDPMVRAHVQIVPTPVRIARFLAPKRGRPDLSAPTLAADGPGDQTARTRSGRGQIVRSKGRGRHKTVPKLGLSRRVHVHNRARGLNSNVHVRNKGRGLNSNARVHREHETERQHY